MVHIRHDILVDGGRTLSSRKYLRVFLALSAPISIEPSLLSASGRFRFRLSPLPSLNSPSSIRFPSSVRSPSIFPFKVSSFRCRRVLAQSPPHIVFRSFILTLRRSFGMRRISDSCRTKNELRMSVRAPWKCLVRS
jgi:hypothetical protein